MGNRNIITATITTTTILFLLSCGRYNPKERNRLVFTDDIENVSNSVREMNVLMSKYNGAIYDFVIDNRILSISDTSANIIKIGKIDDSLLYESKELYFMDKNDRFRFIQLTLFLNKNYLGWTYFKNGLFLYQYRSDIDMGDMETDLERFVVYVYSEKEIDDNHYKILDRYKNLYLLTNKDAEIWSSE